jgi:hypothetical protein
MKNSAELERETSHWKSPGMRWLLWVVGRELSVTV